MLTSTRTGGTTRRQFALGSCASVMACSAAPAPEPPLNLDDFRLTFDDSFRDLSISSGGPDTRWTAHTPWAGDFGDAVFTDPTPGFPFTLRNGRLAIEARREADGKWRSGLISSVDGAGRGFSQMFGYFEMAARMPTGPGVWPAFWLVGLDRKTSTAELDIVEYYGHAPAQFHTNIHVWKKDGEGDGTIVQVAPGLLTEKFNLYGGEIGPKWTDIYFNRQRVWRTLTLAPFNQPMGILANLALGSGWPIDKTPNPSIMEIEYIRAYARKA